MNWTLLKEDTKKVATKLFSMIIVSILVVWMVSISLIDIIYVWMYEGFTEETFKGGLKETDYGRYFLDPVGYILGGLAVILLLVLIGHGIKFLINRYK